MGRWNIKVQFKSSIFMGRALWRTMEAGILEAIKYFIDVCEISNLKCRGISK